MRTKRSDVRNRRNIKRPFVAIAAAAFTLGLQVAASATQGDTSTVAGDGNAGYCDTVPNASSTACRIGGVPIAPRMNNPKGVAVGSDGTVYFTEDGPALPAQPSLQQTVRKITAAGIVRSLAGSQDAFADGGGIFEETCTLAGCDGARFNRPTGVVADASGVLYIADSGNNRIRKVVTAAPVGGALYGTVTVSTLAGMNAGFADGTGTAASFNGPTSVAINPAGTDLYVTDFNNNRIRKVVIATGVVTTYAGGARGFADGGVAAATFAGPADLEFDAAGNLFVVDASNYTIRKITAGGVVSTLAGTVGAPGYIDAVGTSAKFSQPNAIAVQPDGTAYVSDSIDNVIRKISTTGSVSTLAGIGTGFGEGYGAQVQFNGPSGLAINNTTGFLYVADSGNNRVRKVDLNAPVLNNSGIIAINPTRLVDTRTAGATPRVTVLGGNVPSNAIAVALNVTATEGTGPGFLTVWPCDDPAGQPSTSNLNFAAGQTVANAVVSKVGTNGQVCLASGGGSVKYIVDINGYVPAGSPVVSINPKRIMDTRVGNPTDDPAVYDVKGILAPAVTRTVPVSGRFGAPASGSVAINVTVTGATGPGYLTVWPCGTKPLASNVNFSAGQTVPNLVTTTLSAGGAVCFETTNASANVIADLQAYAPGAGSLAARTPARLLDTRGGTGPDVTIDTEGRTGGLVAAGTEIQVRVIGRGGVSATARTAVLNVTVTGTAGPGFVTAYPCGSQPATVSNVNYTGAGQTVANLVTVKIGAGGKVCLKPGAAGTYLIADLMAVSSDI
jgi:sugar lactone lactonase YvrE